MLSARWSALPIRRLCLGLLAVITLVLCSGCSQPSVMTYSIEEQYDLAFTRSDNMRNQLEFSFHLERDHVPVGQDIFFVATFTNTLDHPLVFKEPRQKGVMEQDYPDTTLLFSVEPIAAGISLRYPLDSYPYRLLLNHVARDEFVTLPSHGSREIRLQLPHMAGTLWEQFPLPPGQYLVRMTYMNYYIGYLVDQNGEPRHADLNAWVGEVEADPVVLTITEE